MAAGFPNSQEQEAQMSATTPWMKRPSGDENTAPVQRAMPKIDREKIERQYDRLNRLGWMPGTAGITQPPCAGEEQQASERRPTEQE